MLACYLNESSTAVPIIPVLTTRYTEWLEQQAPVVKNWLRTANFTAKSDTYCLIPNTEGQLSQVVLGLHSEEDFWGFGLLPAVLPAGVYRLTGLANKESLLQAAMAWGLGAYQFTRYKASNRPKVQLLLPQEVDAEWLHALVTSLHWVRDLINTPTQDMGPAQLGEAALSLAEQYGAEVQQIVAEELLAHHYPTIHAVGRASHQAPRLIDLRWGDHNLPKVTLVGKGVCFDSGGLDLKTAAGMALMKKDMGGAAHVLGLARLVMAANLPLCLRVLVPAVENVVAGNAYKPGDIITTRKGITVEIGNTDAEGRLILCDALAEAVSEQPDLLLDFATLTGAARVALGTEIAAFFSNNEQLAERLMQHAQAQQDPLWRLPLYAPYRKLIDSNYADINNAGSSSYAGAITAALFLQEFVPSTIPWAHFDLMAWNVGNRPGRPEGGEAMGLRAVFSYLQAYCANKIKH